MSILNRFTVIHKTDFIDKESYVSSNLEPMALNQCRIFISKMMEPSDHIIIGILNMADYVDSINIPRSYRGVKRYNHVNVINIGKCYKVVVIKKATAETKSDTLFGIFIADDKGKFGTLTGELMPYSPLGGIGVLIDIADTLEFKHYDFDSIGCRVKSTTEIVL